MNLEQEAMRKMKLKGTERVTICETEGQYVKVLTIRKLDSSPDGQEYKAPLDAVVDIVKFIWHLINVTMGMVLAAFMFAIYFDDSKLNMLSDDFIIALIVFGSVNAIISLVKLIKNIGGR